MLSADLTAPVQLFSRIQDLLLRQVKVFTLTRTVLEELSHVRLCRRRIRCKQPPRQGFPGNGRWALALNDNPMQGVEDLDQIGCKPDETVGTKPDETVGTKPDETVDFDEWMQAASNTRFFSAASHQ